MPEEKELKKKQKEQNDQTSRELDIGLEMAQNDLVQRHGEAASQMLQAYKGVRYDTSGQELEYHGRNLADISHYKINPDYQEQNYKQQSGFSAELIEEARKNKQHILKGEPERTRTTDGQGRHNDTQYDHIEVDGQGQEIAGSGSQMKFLKSGVDGDGDRTFQVIDNLAKDKKWDRYDTVVDIPKEDYEDALKYADKQADKLSRQAEHARKQGKEELAKKLEEEADGFQKAKERIRKSDTKKPDAMAARKNPKLFTAKEVLKDSHQAGLQAAGGAALFAGAFSIGKNIIEVLEGEKSLEEAAVEVGETTAEAGLTAYGVGAAGTALKAIMHTSKQEVIRRLGTTNAPMMIVSGALEVTKSMVRYAKGELDELELLEELGEKGTGMVAAGFGASVGTAALAGAGAALGLTGMAAAAIGTAGAIIGGMIGYQLCSVLYHGAVDTLKRERMSEERRRVLEQVAKEAIARTRRYRQDLEQYAKEAYDKREIQIEEFLEGLYQSMRHNEIDDFISRINSFGTLFGVTLQFQSFQELDEFMSDETTVLEL